MSNEISKKNSLSKKALMKIQDAINSGDLRPNQRLIESQLSRKFGMSRTPIREAIRRLQPLGQVTILPNGGAIVTEHSQKNIKDQFEVREALETLVVELACERITEEQISQARKCLELSADSVVRHDLDKFTKFNGMFHDLLLEACDNDRLITIIKTIRNLYYLRRLAHTMTEAEMSRLLKYYNALLNSLNARNKSGAKKSIRLILRSTLKITLLKQYLSNFI
jgi:DNA-binding GntR family transcriptional regulator